MPRLLSLVLRRSGAIAALLAVIVLCLALPARHILLPLWPDRVDEILIEAGSGQVKRQFQPADASAFLDAKTVARSRPITLWRLETRSGEVTYAWLAGVRDGEGRLLPALPAWLETVRLDGPLPDTVQLVITTAAREIRKIDSTNIERMYRPNGMRFTDRLALWRDRFQERWQWPLTPAGDARMTPPAR